MIIATLLIHYHIDRTVDEILMDFQKVLRSLPHLSPVRATAVCGALLAKLHLLAKGDKVDTRWE